MNYLIDKILPSKEVHLIAGPSGSGKTTWILQTLVGQWQKGEDVLGFKSHPCPWVYISSDRSLQSVLATMERLGISPQDFNLTSAVDAGLHTIDDILKAVRILNPQPRLLYIDGLLNTLPDKVHPNDNKSVSRWLADLTRTCQRENITIWGSLHSPKMKKDEWYDNPRQRIAGGASWAGFADTIAIMEPSCFDDPSKSHHRRLLVLPRNHKEINVELMFDSNGHLVDAKDDVSFALFHGYLANVKPGGIFTRETVEIVLDSVSPSTIGTWLSRAVDEGIIERIDRGRYRKTIFATPGTVKEG